MRDIYITIETIPSAFPKALRTLADKIENYTFNPELNASKSIKIELSNEQNYSVLFIATLKDDSRFEFKALSNSYSLKLLDSTIAQILLHEDNNYSIVIQDEEKISGVGTLEQAKKVCLEYIKRKIFE